MNMRHYSSFRNVILLILLIQILFVKSETISQYLASEGNENQIATRYFKLSNHTFDQPSYYQQVSRCFGKVLSRMSLCIQELNSKIFPSQRIWLPSDAVDRNPADRKPDCQYKVSQRHAKTHFHQYDSRLMTVNYHFMIEQSDCISKWEESGGASFIITAHDDFNLVACRYKDTHDNNYHVSCSFRRSILSNHPTSYIYMTILLEYEHYDAFSESLTGEVSPYLHNSYNSLRHLVIDNQEYTFEVATKEHLLANKSYVVAMPHHQITIISGEWLAPKTCSELYHNDCHMYLNNNNIIAYDHHKSKNETSSLAIGNMINNINFPYIVRSQDAKTFSERYSFHPIISNNNNPSAPVHSAEHTITFSPFDTSKTIHFIGSSHIRFSFDSITEYFGMGYFPGGLTTAGNMISYHASDLYFSIFADDQADKLIEGCKTMSSDKNHTIVFMTGAWDLTFVSIRRIYEDPITGYKLATAIRHILEGKIACPNLERFIWLTEIPYSPCYDDADTQCKATKGFRTNGAIAALNEYYINALSDVQVRDGLKFTIIDAFSIIAPRLQLLPDMEYDCSFHYHCKYYKHVQEPLEPKLLGHTPGGDAMVRAILLALS